MGNHSSCSVFGELLEVEYNNYTEFEIIIPSQEGMYVYVDENSISESSRFNNLCMWACRIASYVDE